MLFTNTYSIFLLHDKKKTFTHTHVTFTKYTKRQLLLAPEAAKQLLDNLLCPDAPRVFPLFAFLRNGRRNEVSQIATHHSAPLQIGPIIVHLEQPRPVIVLVTSAAATPSSSSSFSSSTHL